MSEEKELAKSYDPKQVEDRMYKTWVEKGYFTPKVDKKRSLIQ